MTGGLLLTMTSCVTPPSERTTARLNAFSLVHPTHVSPPCEAADSANSPWFVLVFSGVARRVTWPDWEMRAARTCAKVAGRYGSDSIHTATYWVPSKLTAD